LLIVDDKIVDKYFDNDGVLKKTEENLEHIMFNMKNIIFYKALMSNLDSDDLKLRISKIKQIRDNNVNKSEGLFSLLKSAELKDIDTLIELLA
jgi:hypothetical protein